MNKIRLLIRLILVFMTPFILTAQSRIKPDEILHQAELKRLPWAQMSLYASLADSGSNGPSITAYHVFFNADKALVVCIEPQTQKGNLLLLQNHELWMYIKSTAQPMKITPLQRLSGSVSFVDIARLNWATDFFVDSFETVKLESKTKQETYLLHIKSISPEVSYKRVNLWIDKNSKRPVKADIYLSSEKLYKTVLFTKYQTISGKEINTRIEFIDHFNKGRKSVINFSKFQQEKSLPENYFIKEKLPDISKSMSN